MWIRDERRKVARNNQDTNNSMESYQGHMKDVLFIRRRNAHEKRMDDTVHKLLLDVCISYWYKAQKKIAGVVKNKKKDRHVCNVIIKARSMIRLIVTWPTGYAGPALVTSQTRPNKRYIVNWKLDRYACECFWSLQGNYCKHQVQTVIGAEIYMYNGLSFFVLFHSGYLTKAFIVLI
jgi:hypothetical protein